MANSGDIGGRGKERDTSPETEMEFFDALPPKLRAALRQTNFSWPAKDCFALLARGKNMDQMISQMLAYEAHLSAVRNHG